MSEPKIDIEHHIGALMNDIKDDGIEKMVTIMLLGDGELMIRYHAMSQIEVIGSLVVAQDIIRESGVIIEDEEIDD